MSLDAIRSAIREIPDFPKPGIRFKDITPVLRDPVLFHAAVGLFVDRHRGRKIRRIAAIESRGFLLGAAIAHELGAGIVPIRKKGKLPYRTLTETYALEYGSDSVEVHEDAFDAGEEVLLVDDVLATGGTAAAAARLIERAGARVVEVDVLIELTFLNGRASLNPRTVFAPIAF
ncbi:MAG: adenine phosphoribosyltransferase [Kiritimatiellae bacterium]|nr:adenine phosphoribosyltransferase [Kiritimatiellia bacterium]MDW8457859.1 adenine phosphoribosyltransferase [Verrucomicrobiota bacterium]